MAQMQEQQRAQEEALVMAQRATLEGAGVNVYDNSLSLTPIQAVGQVAHAPGRVEPEVV